MMKRFEHAPIYRHSAIAPFSRDHYVGLVQAQHMLKAASGTPSDRRQVVAEFIRAWENDIVVHFRDEERLLLPLMSEHDQRVMLTDHKEIAVLAERLRTTNIQNDPDPSLMQELGERMRNHIRWEERELFDRLQWNLGDNQLEALQRATGSIEEARPRTICRSPRAESAPAREVNPLDS